MIVTVHQPTFLPYLGFFDKILKSDIFIIYDTAQYVRQNFMNRNRINHQGNDMFINIEVERGANKKEIKDVLLKNNTRKKFDKILKSIEISYKKTPYYNDILPILKNMFNIFLTSNKLINGNVYFIKEILKLFNWNGKIYFASNLNINDNNSTLKLINMTKKVGGTYYLSGNSGVKYMELGLFKRNNVGIIFQNFNHPIYLTSSKKEFKYNLTILDYMFTNYNNTEIFNTNKEVYNDIVYKFKNYNDDELMPIEVSTFNSLFEILPNLEMLDIGIGCGRTTKFFIERVKSYYGIDYSIDMIKEAHLKFPNYKDKLEVADARNLSLIGNHKYDLVLFSFNGIDYVSHEDRLKILKEIYRVTKDGGYFILSSHNLISNEENVRHIENTEQYNYYITKDKHNLETYYIKPSVFVKQLNEIGFFTEKIFGYNGEEYKDFNNIPKTNHWPYYFTKKI